MLIIRVHSYDGAHHFYVGPPEHAYWKIINLVMLSIIIIYRVSKS